MVCLANTDGGEIYLGVEDDGQVSGLHPQHQNLSTLAAMIARRLDTNTLAQAIQRDEASARSVLERLVEAGLVEAHGVKKGRTYTLSPQVYRELGQSADYVRQAGFNPIQQEQMVLSYVKTHGKITRHEAMELCRISEDQASRLLRKLTAIKQLKLVGQHRGAHYVIP